MAKTITALYGNTLCIDPVGQTPESINKIKEKVEKQLNKKLELFVAPASKWMPSTAADTLARQVAKELGTKYIPITKKK